MSSFTPSAPPFKPIVRHAEKYYAIRHADGREVSYPSFTAMFNAQRVLMADWVAQRQIPRMPSPFRRGRK